MIIQRGRYINHRMKRIISNEVISQTKIKKKKEIALISDREEKFIPANIDPRRRLSPPFKGDKFISNFRLDLNLSPKICPVKKKSRKTE